MIIVICNGYPQYHQYVKTQPNPKGFMAAYSKEQFQQCWSVITTEVRIIEYPHWIDVYELHEILRRMRIQR